MTPVDREYMSEDTQSALESAIINADEDYKSPVEIILFHGDEDDATQPLDRIRDEDLWYEDGNVILVACYVEFRIYRGPLVKHSPVFQEMLSSPNTAVESSIPILILNDHPQNLKAFLQGFCFGNELRFADYHTHPDFGTISAMIRLGYKYRVETAVKSAVDYLRAYYPTDYPNVKQHPRGAPGFEDYEHIGVINLARLTRTQELLPMAFLRCCAIDPDQLMEGFRRNKDGKLEKLVSDDVVRVLMGREQLLKANANVFNAWSVYPGDSGCASEADNKNDCVDFLAHVRGYLSSDLEELTWSADWARTWAAFAMYGMQDAPRPCTVCLDLLRNMEDWEREELWRQWPYILKLDEIAM